jgi:hypothetical protein
MNVNTIQQKGKPVNMITNGGKCERDKYNKIKLINTEHNIEKKQSQSDRYLPLPHLTVTCIKYISTECFDRFTRNIVGLQPFHYSNLELHYT